MFRAILPLQKQQIYVTMVDGNVVSSCIWLPLSSLLRIQYVLTSVLIISTSDLLDEKKYQNGVFRTSYRVFPTQQKNRLHSVLNALLSRFSSGPGIECTVVQFVSFDSSVWRRFLSAVHDKTFLKNRQEIIDRLDYFLWWSENLQNWGWSST